MPPPSRSGLACLLLLPTPLAPGDLSAATRAGATARDESRHVESLPRVPPWRERAAAVNRMLLERLEDLLPALMRECGLDMWLVINREYAEDPVYLTLVPEPVFAARRTTILLFHDRGAAGEGADEGVGGLERLTVSRYALGEFYESAWPEGGSDDAQWQRLAALVAQRDPERIGIDVSEHWAFGDGLSSGLHERLRRALGEQLSARLVSAQELCLRWLETRTELEMQVYPELVQLARGVIAEAFSNRVVTPGVTTTEDVAWYIRQRFSDLGLDTWFQPYCNVQREGVLPEPGSAFHGLASAVIERGDVLHTDVGIHCMRLATDTQEMGYVLRMGEEEAPPGLQAALEVGNRWQDLLTAEFRVGRSGNQVLAATRAAAAAEGISCTVYTHPLGFHGHAAGPTIGMWDNQGGTPVRGDWSLHAGTAYAIEGNVLVTVPEWGGQSVQIKLEQDAFFDGREVRYIGGRQTRWHLIR